MSKERGWKQSGHRVCRPFAAASLTISMAALLPPPPPRPATRSLPPTHSPAFGHRGLQAEADVRQGYQDACPWLCTLSRPPCHTRAIGTCECVSARSRLPHAPTNQGILDDVDGLSQGLGAERQASSCDALEHVHAPCGMCTCCPVVSRGACVL